METRKVNYHDPNKLESMVCNTLNKCVGYVVYRPYCAICLQSFRLTIFIKKKKMTQTSDQKQRSSMREKFLKTLLKLEGQNCSIEMYENTNVTCKLNAVNPTFESIIVEDLVTPVPPVIRRAILRTSDIISIHFEVPLDAISNK